MPLKLKIHMLNTEVNIITNLAWKEVSFLNNIKQGINAENIFKKLNFQIF